MIYKANSPEEYLDLIPSDRKEPIKKLRKIINENLPVGFEERMSYGGITYVVPHSIYPAGYHVNPAEPLPFMGIASQKHFIGLYHLGIYSYPDVLSWFQGEYPKYVKTKLDIGKSCIRFKKMETIPYELIAELCKKITVEDYCKTYEKHIKKQTK